MNRNDALAKLMGYIDSLASGAQEHLPIIVEQYARYGMAKYSVGFCAMLIINLVLFNILRLTVKEFNEENDNCFILFIGCSIALTICVVIQFNMMNQLFLAWFSPIFFCIKELKT